MKVPETILACAVAGLAWFVGGETLGMPQASVRQEAAGRIGRAARADAPRTSDVTRSPRPARTALPSLAEPTPRRGADARLPVMMRRRVIAAGARGTYVHEVLIERDSAIARWPDHVDRPLRVYVGDGGALDGWNADYVSAVRDAFDRWSRTGIPVRFTFVVDPALADISVEFRDRFAEGISGKTIWSRDDDHWLQSADIQLALTHPAGGFVSVGQMRAIALHEVGHLLGLDHTTSADHIMSPRIRVRDLSDGDQATVRLLYSVPAGSLR